MADRQGSSTPWVAFLAGIVLVVAVIAVFLMYSGARNVEPADVRVEVPDVEVPPINPPDMDPPTIDPPPDGAPPVQETPTP